jgi:hypothetical protein
LYKVRVKRKGQVTKPLSGIKPGEAVGQKEYDRIIKELDQLRSE